MLQLSTALLNRPILSLRTGHQVATVTAPIINPDNLKIEAFYCTDSRSKDTLVLLHQDIRDFIPRGYVINDFDVLAEPSELIRLHKYMEINFNPIGKSVRTVSKVRVGKVSDYVTDVDSMYIQKLYIAQSLLKHLTGGNLSIDRTQIQEITDTHIIVQDLLKTVPSAAPAQA